MKESIGSKDFFKVKNESNMKNKIGLKIIIIVLVLFFGLQFLSHTFLIIGKKRSDPTNIKFLKLSSHIFPLDAVPLFEYGYILLKKNQQSPDDRILGKSITYLKKSISSNMFYYNAHLYLGKAYLFQNMKDHISFDRALGALKRAGQIRGNNIQVSMDTLTMLLSMWPFLNDENKTFCSTLLNKVIGRINNEDFNSLLETWALYSKDIEFLKNGVLKNPKYHLVIAEKLLQLEMDMNARYHFLSKYSSYIIANLQERYHNYLSEQPPDLLEKLKHLFKGLNRQTTGYYPINPNDKLIQKSYFELKKRLNLNILELFFTKKKWQKESQQRSEINTFIHSFINDFSTMEELRTFNNFLTKKKYFDLQALSNFYIKQLIQFKSGQYDSVIYDIENLRESISFVAKEHMKDYNNILLLLTDAYISSRLLIKAMGVLKKIEKNESTLTDIYWRKMQIERVIGAEEEIDKQKEQHYELIRNSSQVELNALSMGRTLYLTNNNKKVEIQFNPSIKEKIKSYHLLQVFIDRKLFNEAYLSTLKLPLTINIPTEERYSKHTLKINIL